MLASARRSSELAFDQDGAKLFPKALDEAACTRLEAALAALGEQLGLAERGDIWLYATPIVHASLAANPPRRRRVLQVDYSADAAPGPLAWRGL